MNGSSLLLVALILVLTHETLGLSIPASVVNDDDDRWNTHHHERDAQAGERGEGGKPANGGQVGSGSQRKCNR